MLKYKDFIIPTISLFFKAKNDIDVFIEDANDEEFYKSLFHRLVPNNKIGKIISCKCKSELIKACTEDQTDRSRKRIYIADGDLDLISDNNRKDLKFFFVLDRYCIENYLIDKFGIIETLHTNIVLNKDKIEKQLSLENWLKSISHPLIDLFFHYAITHEHQLGTKTVSIPVGAFCKQSKGITVLDIDKVEQKIQQLRSEIITAIGDDGYNESIYKKRQNWPSNVQTLITIVSAKDYILPLLAFRFKKIKGKESYNLKWESLRLSIAKSCNLDHLEDLRKKLIAV